MSNNSKSAVAFLIGAAIGAGIGILLAPDKGVNTREKLKDGFDGTKTNLKNKFTKLEEKFKSTLNSSKDDLESTFDDLAANVNEKTNDVISALENKLAELKQAASTLNK